MPRTLIPLRPNLGVLQIGIKSQDIIMSDSEHSTVTYTSFEDYSDIGLPGVDGPPSPDYVPGPEEPEQAPPSPDYVPGPEAPPSPIYIPYISEPVYPEYILPEDDVFPAEEQPLPAADSPTSDLPGYIPESDPEEDDEEDPADYPANRGDKDDKEEDKEEEEEHLAPADSTTIALPAIDHRLCFASPTPSHEVRESSAASAARQDEPAIPREDPFAVAREDYYRFVDMVDVAPGCPGCPISKELDYGITDE
ncbi:hypothetical protein Tco_0386810 [Tanacetum coccineum]